MACFFLSKIGDSALHWDGGSDNTLEKTSKDLEFSQRKLSRDKQLQFSSPLLNFISLKKHFSANSRPLFSQNLTQGLLPAFSDRTKLFNAKLCMSTDQTAYHISTYNFYSKDQNLDLYPLLFLPWLTILPLPLQTPCTIRPW